MKKNTVLIVDDEPDLCDLVALSLTRLDIDSDTVHDITSAKKKLANNNYALCLTDMKLPDGNGMDLISHITQLNKDLPVAMITAHGNMDTAIDALKRGAFDFLTKPIELNKLDALVNAALALSHTPALKSEGSAAEQLIGNSLAALELRKTLAKVARSQAPVFIRGESGSGKEVAARLIHQHSARNAGAFIAVNCGAIPAELVESEFFGHKKGSFTGATHDKTGLFEAANGGSLLLDEIADLPLAMQVKLLRAIQEQRVKPVGSNSEITIDVRLLSATHKDLRQLVEDNLFRSDLFYRINVIDINIPPLRDRIEDIKPISEKILIRISNDTHHNNLSLSAAALEKIKRYSFPGNIRELENVLERAAALCETAVIDEHDIILDTAHKPLPSQTVHDLPLNDKEENNDGAVDNAYRQPEQPLDDYLHAIEKREILAALEKCRWNKTEAAKTLQMSFRSFRYRMEKLKIDE
jgi:two-component system response regulator PilR (NtrC family)